MARARSNARRYAEAAFELADRDGTVEAWLDALDRATEALSGEDILRVLSNPAIPFHARGEVLDTVLGGRIPELPSNLVRLLLQRGRIERLPDVAREFRRLYDRRAGIVAARVVSALPLDEIETAALRQRLAAMTGGRIDMTTTVDPSLLGGIQVRLGDRLLDGSVRGRLERLRSRLASGSL